MAFLGESFEFMLDIDYILEWIEPGSTETHYKFWVVPATLVFQNVHDLRVDLEPFMGVEIQGLNREDPQKPENAEDVGHDTEWRWTIETHEGEISLSSSGFTQYLRREPIYSEQVSLDLNVRGGISFGRGRGNL